MYIVKDICLPTRWGRPFEKFLDCRDSRRIKYGFEAASSQDYCSSKQRITTRSCDSKQLFCWRLLNDKQFSVSIFSMRLIWLDSPRARMLQECCRDVKVSYVAEVKVKKLHADIQSF